MQNEFKDITDDFTSKRIKSNIEHAVTMCFLEATGVLIKSNDIDYNTYTKLLEQLRGEFNKLKVKLVDSYAK